MTESVRKRLEGKAGRILERMERDPHGRRLLARLRGTPQVTLAPTWALHAEITTKFGEYPAPQDVDALWRDAAGTSQTPGWFALSARDTPSGTVWKLLFCPAQGTLPAADIALPQVLWIQHLMESNEESAGIRRLETRDGSWIGTWGDGGCQRLQGPLATGAPGLQRELDAAQHAQPEADIAELFWQEPTAHDLQQLASQAPEAQLLAPSVAAQRMRQRETRTLQIRLTAVVLGAVLLSAMAWLPAAALRLELYRAEVRMEGRLPLLHAIDSLGSRLRTSDSLVTRQDVALSPSSRPGKLLAMLPKALPEDAHIEILQMEAHPPASEGAWIARLQLRQKDWDKVATTVEGLKHIPGVTSVDVGDQARDPTGLRYQVTLQGRYQ